MRGLRWHLAARVTLGFRVYSTFLVVVYRLRIRRLQLPVAVSKAVQSPRLTLPRGTPVNLGFTIHRLLSVGRFQPRCLTLALVHFTLLTRVGLEPALLVGLPRSDSSDAHAWVELGGIDVGPPPGRDGSTELARFGRFSPA